MNLKTIYEKGGRKALRELAAKTGNHELHLYQCATGRKEPSPKLARRLFDIDNRITPNNLYLTDEQKSKL